MEQENLQPGVSPAVLIIGAGAFGAALAACATMAGNSVTLLARSEKGFAQLEQNTALKNCTLQTFAEFATPFSKYQLIILAIPCQSLRSVCQWMQEKDNAIEPARTKELFLLCAAKGIEQNTLLLPHQIVEQFWPTGAYVGSISGPTFASELLESLPTCVVVASKHKELCTTAIDLLHTIYFRIYGTNDIIGTEVGGALKNVIAMVAGASDGLKLGNNARAAVITRGISEMAAIGVKLGANPLTFLGLSGVGDLTLTCTGDLSRNRQFGMRLARGETLEQIASSMGQVIEGVATAQSAYFLMKSLDLDCSIISSAYSVLYEKTPIQEVILNILSRIPQGEFNWLKN